MDEWAWISRFLYCLKAFVQVCCAASYRLTTTFCWFEVQMCPGFAWLCTTHHWPIMRRLNSQSFPSWKLLLVNCGNTGKIVFILLNFESQLHWCSSHASPKQSQDSCFKFCFPNFKEKLAILLVLIVFVPNCSQNPETLRPDFFLKGDCSASLRFIFFLESNSDFEQLVLSPAGFVALFPGLCNRAACVPAAVPPCSCLCANSEALPISPWLLFFTSLNVASSLFLTFQVVLNLERGFKSNSALNSVVNLPFSWEMGLPSCL